MVFLSVLLYVIQWCARRPYCHRHAVSLVSWQLFTSLFWSVSDVMVFWFCPRQGMAHGPRRATLLFCCLLRAPRRVCCGYAASQDPSDFQWTSEGRGALERRSKALVVKHQRNGELGWSFSGIPLAPAMPGGRSEAKDSAKPYPVSIF